MGKHDTEAFTVDLEGEEVRLRLGDTRVTLPRAVAEQLGAAISDTLRDVCLYGKRRVTLTTPEVMALDLLSLRSKHSYRGYGRQITLQVPARAVEFYATAGDPKCRMAQALLEDFEAKFKVWAETCLPSEERTAACPP